MCTSNNVQHGQHQYAGNINFSINNWIKTFVRMPSINHWYHSMLYCSMLWHCWLAVINASNSQKVPFWGTALTWRTLKILQVSHSKVQSPTQLATTHAHYILLFNTVSCNCMHRFHCRKSCSWSSSQSLALHETFSSSINLHYLRCSFITEATLY